MAFLNEYRCKYCNKLFFKGALDKATIEIKCRNCKNYNVIEGKNCKLILFSDNKGAYSKDNVNNPKVQAIIRCNKDKEEEKGFKHASESCPVCYPEKN